MNKARLNYTKRTLKFPPLLDLDCQIQAIGGDVA